MAEKHTITIPVGGMSCQHCVDAVNRALSGMAGVEAVTVSLQKGTVDVIGAGLDIPALRSAIEDLGFDAGEVA